MAEILGLGCSHGPIILTPPQAWAKGWERIFARVPDYQPPPQALARDMRNALIRDGIDLASANALQGWEWGLPHAHINPLMFLDPEGRFPLLPFFVNCYGEEAGPDYPPRPSPRRCYEVGRAMRRFLDTRSERVAVVASSSWSHSFLAHKFQCCAIDLESGRRNLELVRCGKGSALAELSPEQIHQSGDHKLIRPSWWPCANRT